MKHEIEIPDLPEGWEPVTYRPAIQGVDYVLRNGAVTIYNGFSDTENLLIVRKKYSRRIVLEETEEETDSTRNHTIYVKYVTIDIYSDKVWKIVEDNKCSE